MARTGLSFLRPTVTLTHDDATGYYTLVTQKPFLPQELKFRLGEEFDEVTEEGRSVKSTITMFGNRMLHVQSGRKGLKIERVFGDDEMVAVSNKVFLWYFNQDGPLKYGVDLFYFRPSCTRTSRA